MEAGIPEHVCLKANRSGLRTGLICERDARFYHLISEGFDCPVPIAYYADRDGDGSGNGVVVMEDPDRGRRGVVTPSTYAILTTSSRG